MKFNLDADMQKEIVQSLETAENKSEAIYAAMDKMLSVKHEKMIEELTEQNEKAAADEDYRKSLNLRVLSKEETSFYEKLKDVKQAITASQIDIIPTSIVDRTLDDVKKASDLLSLVNFAPADVKKWIIGSHTGKAVWGELTDQIKGELNATLKGIDFEQHKLTVFIVIPKAIRELSYPFVDKYFTAILAEAMQDGLEDGYLNGNGKTGPVGLMNKLEQYKSDGTATAKTVLQTVKKFSPKGLLEVRKTLSNDGKRVVSELELICNPLDEAEYVDPALYGEALVGGYKNTSFMPINKHVTTNCPKGKGILTIKGVYTMGATNVRFTEYDQTKAMEDADLIIGKCCANGAAIDDNCAVVFDVTKLEEYVLPVTQVTAGGVGA